MFELRDRKIAEKLIAKIKELNIEAQFMHVCGTHQDTLVRYGIDSMLVDTGITIRQGPGCPVCVTTPKEIEEALALADAGVAITVFGDMLRVPGEKRSLADARAEGGDVRVVYSVSDALKMAKNEPDTQFVFMGIGFETTVPSTAAVLLSQPPKNFSVLSCHRTIPNALKALINMGEVRINGLIEPGHVSTILGMEPYQFLSTQYNVPQVIAGFEPLDLLMGIYMLTRQIKNGEAKLENEYTRVVRPEGNPKAKAAISKAFRPTDVAWRGFPMIPGTGLEISEEYDEHNARLLYKDILQSIWNKEYPEPPGCKCGEVLRGIMEPDECALFGNKCIPSNPIGPCMVSAEGGCQIAYKYGKRH